jgi:hypothetical protein
MEELLHIFHRLDTTSEALPTPIRGHPTTGRHSEPVPQPTQPSAQVGDVRLSLSDKYDGTRSKYHCIPLQCSLYFAHQKGAPTTERSKVATVISLLT